MTVTLVLGGARSGKSRYAESLGTGERHYVATAQAFDEEMKARITRHRADRGGAWTTHEVTTELAGRIGEIDRAGRFILVDCLTLWLSNVILAGQDWQAAAAELQTSLASISSDLVLVSNEVGMGIIPENALAREFRDAQGFLNQRIAARADRVVFVAAGLPMILKG